MKKLSKIIVIIAFLGLCSCGPSNEEKAQQMAAEYLKGELYHFDSYEPIQIKIDSSFVSLTSDKEAISLTLEIIHLCQSLQEYTQNIEMAESSMDIWTPDAYSLYSQGEYMRAKNERDKNQRLLNKTFDRIQTLIEKIKARQSDIKEGDFKGWKVYHKFKSLNGEGSMALFGEFIFFCDKDFNLEFAYSKEDMDAISKVIEAVLSSDNLHEFGEQLQESYL